MFKSRFAPSPTGALHVGGIRTALFAYLAAKRHHGQFVLRIEDTDLSRSTQASVDVILDGMAWLGLKADGAPIFQGASQTRHHQIIEQLLKQGLAYRCNCSKARLDQIREQQISQQQTPRYDGHCRDLNLPQGPDQVIRFKMPKEGSISWQDAVRGEIIFENNQLDDWVVLRSDQMPTYNLACTVDDIDMNITHVIRGEDHINNTPKQIHLYHALGATCPTFAHVPNILGTDGKKLSKRHGAVSVMQFKQDGYLPQALLNYLVRLGWSHGDQEIFSKEEMIQLFDLKQVSASASAFDVDKLLWLNQYYIKQMPDDQLTQLVIPFFHQADISLNHGPDPKLVVALFKERARTLVELVELSGFLYQDFETFDPSAAKKHLRPVVLEPLELVFQRFSQLDRWHVDEIMGVMNDVVEQFELKFPKIAMPLRVALTGKGNSPAIDQIIELLGQDKTLARLSVAIEWIRARSKENT